MSWAEIKKAVNSDLNIPLDNYLKGNCLKLYTSTSSSPIDFSISSKIILYEIKVSAPKNGSITVKFDDEFIFNNLDLSNTEYSWTLSSAYILGLVHNTSSNNRPAFVSAPSGSEPFNDMYWSSLGMVYNIDIPYTGTPAADKNRGYTWTRPLFCTKGIEIHLSSIDSNSCSLSMIYELVE